MSSKRPVALVLLACLVLFASCRGGDPSETDPTGADAEKSYSEMYTEYMAREVNANVTLTVSGDIELTNRFSLVQSQEGYTVTDLDSGESRVMTSGESACKVAGYLPPYETAYPQGEDQVCELAGDINLEMLLSGSNLFDGYTYKDAELDGSCMYIAHTDTGINRYSYEFKTVINDEESSFTVQVKYLIEVNR